MRPPIRRMAAIAICLLVPLFFAGAGGAAQKPGERQIKVLILDESTKVPPGDGENLVLLEKVKGELVSGKSNFSGDMEIWKGEKGLFVINEVPLEDYVEGVVKAESGEDWSMEALKAQAVVVRTYTLNQIKKKGDRNFDVTSSVLHQVYRGQNTDTLVAEAVRQTRGQVLTYQGEPILALYHSTCGGTTEESEEVFGMEYPYLKSKSASCSLSPLVLWTRRIPLKDIEAATGTKGIKDMKVAALTKTGRAKEIDIEANPETLRIEAKDLRKRLGWFKLPSTAFDVRLEGSTAVIEGKGYGHGVGLCQWSALEMSLNGKNYREILSFYYPGTKLETYADEGL